MAAPKMLIAQEESWQRQSTTCVVIARCVTFPFHRIASALKGWSLLFLRGIHQVISQSGSGHKASTSTGRSTAAKASTKRAPDGDPCQLGATRLARLPGAYLRDMIPSKRTASCQSSPQGAGVPVCQGNASLGPADPVSQLDRPPRISVVVSGCDHQSVARADHE